MIENLCFPIESVPIRLETITKVMNDNGLFQQTNNKWMDLLLELMNHQSISIQLSGFKLATLTLRNDHLKCVNLLPKWNDTSLKALNVSLIIL